VTSRSQPGKATSKIDNERQTKADLPARFIVANLLLVGTRARFFLSSAFFFFVTVSLASGLVPGQIYALKFVDIDGHAFSTTDGHVTVLVLTTNTDLAKARAVGDKVPDFCLANPTYRMITVLNLNRKYSRIARPMVTWLIRKRLNLEAQRLQQRYDARQISRDARRDVFAVADFDGSTTSQVGAQSEESVFAVFVFDRDGKLVRQWNEVPNAADLADALK